MKINVEDIDQLRPREKDAKALCKKHSAKAVIILAFYDDNCGAACWATSREICLRTQAILLGIADQFVNGRIPNPVEPD